ncbi:kininogen-1 [Rhinoraja longicauda]
MKLLCVALFLIQLLNIDAESEPESTEIPEILHIDCNETEVAVAVDFSLRKFNAELKKGNQFALYRITDALVQKELTKRYFLKFSIRETDCPIGNENIWRDCNYRAPREASTGECSSEVLINVSLRITQVVSHNCDLVPKLCAGCLHPVPHNHSAVSKVSAHAIKTFNGNNTYENYFRIAEVYNITQQVVAGMSYTMTFRAQETECSKETPVADEDVIECPFKINGALLHCFSTLYEVVWLNQATGTVSCRPIPPGAIGMRRSGWGPFGMAQVSAQTTPAEAHVITTCPGKPWKSIRQVKPALPPSEEHHESAESHQETADVESHEK